MPARPYARIWGSPDLAGIENSAHNIWDLRRKAKAKLPRAIFEFLERGTEDDLLIQHNRESIERIKFNPRTLRDVTGRDPAITLFGRKQALPLVIAPTGVADLMSYRGERAVAAAASQAGIPFTQTTSSTTSFADIAKVTASGRWLQLYMWEQRELSWAMIEQAGEQGFEVLVVTVDTPKLPLREFNKRNGMSNPIRPNPTLALDFALHPGWFLGVLTRYFLSGGVPQFANYPEEHRTSIRTVSRIENAQSLNWDDIDELRQRWKGPLVIKGILSREDAKLAREHGVDGVCVSNHGGRNFDSSPASIDVLAEIVDDVGKDITVLWDGGVRRGADVLKALAIGAHAVLIGRATLYGAAAAGEKGARHALTLLANEIDMAMVMLGVTRLEELDRSYLRAGTVAGV